ncbi:MAG: SDR family NAD(P)-dependent oxidoreductase [Bdellovibrio sp.]
MVNLYNLNKNKAVKNVLVNAGIGAGLFVAYTLVKNVVRKISFKNKVVLVAGGSRGLGFILAKQLIKEGAAITLLARNIDELQDAKNILQQLTPNAKVMVIPCDCRDRIQVKTAIEETVEHFGCINAVVNCLGVVTTAPIENTTEMDFAESMDTHFWAPYFIIEEALPYLKKETGSRIINIGSIGGIIPIPHLASYCAGKYALEGYSKTLRAELMKYDIHVTTVSPGLMRTGSMGQAHFKGQAQKEYAWFSISSSLPFITVNAERAAKKIIRASMYGKAELVISWPAKLAVQFKSLFPETFADIITFVNTLLPAPGTDEKIKGMEAHSSASTSVFTKLTEKSARRYNEKSI